MPVVDRIQIVETVTATSMAALCAARDRVCEADLIELRVDGVRDLDVAAALRGCPAPAIVTCRPVWEGGRWDGDEAGRRRVMADAVEAGADYVDIERRAGWVPDVRDRRTRVIVSDHDFTGVPSDLSARIHEMRRLGADVVKIAVTATTLSDVLRVRTAVDVAGREGDVVAIAMGDAGQLTRLLPGRFGSCWTYGGDAAPGQVPVRHLRGRYRVGHVTARTRIFGVAGSPVAHSASPAMHNAALAAAGIDAVYVPLLASTASEIAAVAEAIGCEGLSITAPLKAAWHSRPDVRCDDEPSRRLGVVNTLRRDGDQWAARNLDIPGFLDALDQRSIGLAGASVLVLGAGGAGRAAAWAAWRAGANVAISARRADVAAQVGADLGIRTAAWPPTGTWDLVVNATPVGTWPAVDEMPHQWTGMAARVAYDLVYNPAETAWLRAARTSGATVIGGLDMLVGQAARQFEWWMGQPADRRVMREAAMDFVREMTQL